MLFSRKQTPQPVVRLHPNARPHTEVECLIYTTLEDGKIVPLKKLVKILAEQIEREELAHGAASVDIGIWGSYICSREALQLLRTLDGQLIVIDDERCC